MTSWFILMAIAGNAGGCQQVDAERIFAADLAKAIPAFTAVPADTIVGYTPAPGMKRTLDGGELARFGQPYHVEVPLGAEVCFERKMQRVDEAAVRSAILETLSIQGARVEILDMTAGSVPVGNLSFPRNGLSVSTGIDPATPILWRGYVTYDKTRRYAIWARVRISAPMTRVVAVGAIAPGEAVQPNQVRLETYDGFPLRNELTRQVEDVVGRATVRNIREGSAITKADLTEPLLVKRGDSVTISVISGRAQIQFDALAESQGRQGDMISVRNPNGGKLFRARVEGKDKAVVIPGQTGMVARAQ